MNSQITLSNKKLTPIFGWKNKLGTRFFGLMLLLLLVVFNWQCKKDDFTGGTTALCPTVISTDPANAAANVMINKIITATFNEAMDPATINGTTFKVKQGTTAVAGTVTYTGVTAVFTPAANLAINTIYTCTITTGAKDPANNALVSDYVWTFTTGSNSDLTPPIVISTDPANAATGVVLNKKISATFNEVMNPTTITTSTFLLKQGATVITGVVTYTGTTAIFSPSANLLPNLVYTATITTGAQDLAGNGLVADYVWSFTTGTTTDIIPPTVISTDPANAATGVALNKKISATFSETMNPLTINATTFTLKQGLTVVTGTVTYTGLTALFSPTVNLTANTLYTATITTGAQDLAGNGLVADYVWTFTTGATGDIIPPTVISTDPTNGATGVTLNKKIAATFSEAMNPLTINITTFILKQGATTILGTVTYSGTTALFSPSANLLPNTLYTATITTGVQDLAGNAMLSNYVWIFTTGNSADIIPPTVIATDPLNNATAVLLNKKVSATFSEAMNPLTINITTFLLKQGATPIVGTVTYSGTTAVFTPAVNFTPNTLYTATITTGVQDLAGNAMLANYTWSFTTGITLGQGGVDLGTAGNFAILAGAGVTNTGNTIVTGDLGTSPTGTVTGFPPGIVIGTIHAADPIAAQAKLDLTTAYNDAQGRSTGAVSLPGDLSGLTLVPGLYANSTSVMLSAGNVTLDAQGDANAVFIFKMGSTLTTFPGTQVILSGGAQAKNIYWSVGTSGTLGTNSIFYGNILSDQAISLNTGAVLNGRALTRIAAITLQANIVNKP